jgi:hypothetical protein
VNEHRVRTAKLEDDPTAELDKFATIDDDKQRQKRDAFERRMSLAVNVLQSRDAREFPMR